MSCALEAWTKNTDVDIVGKTVSKVEDHPNRWRAGYGDDDGVRITFTDGTSIEISAGMGQGMGYLIGV